MKVVGTGDFNGDGYEDVLISDGKWVGAWMVENGNMTGEVKGFSNSLNGVIEQIGDFNSDGIDDLRLRDGDILGYLSISVDGTATWQQLGKDGVGEEWKTKFSAIC